MGKPAGYGFSIAGWVSEGNLAAIRKRKREYRVGTTRSKLKRFDLSLKILAGFEINNIEGARQHSVITPTVFSALWLALVKGRSFASSVTAGTRSVERSQKCDWHETFFFERFQRLLAH
jgi:hypothetical protein